MLKEFSLLFLTAYVSWSASEPIVEEEIQATKAEKSVQPPPGKTFVKLAYKYLVVTIWLRKNDAVRFLLIFCFDYKPLF